MTVHIKIPNTVLITVRIIVQMPTQERNSERKIHSTHQEYKSAKKKISKSTQVFQVR